ncbi:MAG: glycosyltransferase family 2 protein [Chloroflexi bacterium]|nr:glycosyltransferase family 2 protein [Chloroflexota bacterium]
MTTLSVIIPAYNEVDCIGPSIEAVLGTRAALAEAGVDRLEVIVVDDGSHDGTAEVVGRYPEVTLLCHGTNHGYGAALKTGFSHATGDLCGFLDADGTYPAEAFPELCRAVSAGADVAVGSRRSGAASRMPLVRRVGNALWSRLLTALADESVADPASGMRVFRREVLERLYPLPDGLNFTPVMSTRAVHEGVCVVELPIAYSERVGRSKLNVVRDGMRFLQTVLWTALNYNPVRILGTVGLVFVALGLLLGAVLVVMRLSGITQLGPWGVAAAYGAAVAGLVGVSLFALGATFNYLVSLFHRRPVRQGLFKKPLFRTPLDRHFGWLGLVSLLLGLALGLVALVLGLNGWPVERLWLYLLGGSALFLLGVQLAVYWIIMRVLEELSRRDQLAEADVHGRKA